MDQFARLLKRRAGAILRPNLDHALRAFGHLKHPTALPHKQGEWLLHIHIFAGIACEHRHESVPVIRRGDVNGIDIFVGEELAEIAVLGHPASDQLRGGPRGEATGALEAVGQAAAGEVLHRQERPAAGVAVLEDLDDVREIERRIQKAEQQVPAVLKLPEAPVGVPESFDEHFKIMFDLQVLAFRSEITRIATMMYARDTSGAVYPQSGVREGFHVASHHSNTRANMDRFALINRYHVEMLAYFLDKLKSAPDGDGSLLDHSMILYGSSMSNGNQHDHDPLPVVLAGGAAGQLKGGRHMQYAAHTPMSNLLLAMLDKLGIQADHHGDSTGKLEI